MKRSKVKREDASGPSHRVSHWLCRLGPVQLASHHNCLKGHVTPIGTVCGHQPPMGIITVLTPLPPDEADLWCPHFRVSHGEVGLRPDLSCTHIWAHPLAWSSPISLSLIASSSPEATCSRILGLTNQRDSTTLCHLHQHGCSAEVYEASLIPENLQVHA